MMMRLLTALRMGMAVAAPNMNGNYVLANSESFPTNFSDYPGGVESFDAYHGPINSTYGQVWWTTATDALPADVVARFAGKMMAIVGIEMDQGLWPRDARSLPPSLTHPPLPRCHR